MVHVMKPWSSGRDSDFDDLDEDFVDFDEFDVPLERHIIVSGDDALATTIVEQLFNSGASVVKLAAADLADAGVAAELADAEVGSALAVVCAGEDDATNLEIALLARRANPDVRVVVRLDNDVVRGAMKHPPDSTTRLFVAIYETPEGGFGINGQVLVPRAK